MRVKVGNQKAARYMILQGSCHKCVFESMPLSFCMRMRCDIVGRFDQTGISEDIFKL
jgi:hypothetical protein